MVTQTWVRMNSQCSFINYKQCISGIDSTGQGGCACVCGDSAFPSVLL